MIPNRWPPNLYNIVVGLDLKLHNALHMLVVISKVTLLGTNTPYKIQFLSILTVHVVHNDWLDFELRSSRDPYINTLIVGPCIVFLITRSKFGLYKKKRANRGWIQNLSSMAIRITMYMHMYVICIVNVLYS